MKSRLKLSVKTKIFATLGPSSNTYGTIKALIREGLDVVRLNFSHGTHQSHGEIINIVRDISKEFDKPIPILQDLQGPKLRVGSLKSKQITLKANEEVVLVCDSNFEMEIEKSDSKIIPLDIPIDFSSLSKKGRVLFDDGKIELEIISTTKNKAKAKVILGGILKSNKGVNLPGISLRVSGFTKKDRKDLEYGLSRDVDAVAISFVRTVKDIKVLRSVIKEIDPKKSNLPIIAKLELPEAIKNLESILDEADGVMVARGDLAVETSPSAVPIIQKEIIKAANLKTKLVITATQMLDSMIHNPRPTRAEASDIANAIFDGTDAVMLSGESANGDYPVESVKMMNSIIQAAEQNYEKWGKSLSPQHIRFNDDAYALSLAVRELAYERNVEAIAVFTQSGRSAILQSKARPQIPIFAFTPNIDTYNRLGMYWGVIPYLVQFSDTLENMIKHVENKLFEISNIEEGNRVIIVSGFPIGAMRPTNLALLHTIGSLKH